MDALINGGEEAGAPEGFAGGGHFAAGDHDHVSGEILVGGAEPVGGPGADGGSAELGSAGVEEELGGGVVELVGVHRLDEADVIDVPGEAGHAVGDPGAGLAVLLEGEDGAEELWGAFDEGEGFAFEELGRAVFEVVFDELGLVVEKFLLGRGAGHVEVDDALGLGGNHGGAGDGGAVGEIDAATGSACELGKGEGPEAGVALREEVAAGEVGGLGERRIHESGKKEPR